MDLCLTAYVMRILPLHAQNFVNLIKRVLFAAMTLSVIVIRTVSCKQSIQQTTLVCMYNGLGCAVLKNYTQDICHVLFRKYAGK